VVKFKLDLAKLEKPQSSFKADVIESTVRQVEQNDESCKYFKLMVKKEPEVKTLKQLVNESLKKESESISSM
jgi:hypothetical protein